MIVILAIRKDVMQGTVVDDDAFAKRVELRVRVAHI
jgi:hypothetical protein